MITGGNATVYVSDMDRAVAFHVDRLGLKLQQRFGNRWATIEAGQGLVIGLHPKSEKLPRRAPAVPFRSGSQLMSPSTRLCNT